jgi:YVTN family beta-propeller protein
MCELTFWKSIGRVAVVVALFVLAVTTGAQTPPAGTFAYVTNHSGDSVTVIDTSTNTVVTTIALCAGCSPAGLAVTPDGQFVYVAIQSNGSVNVIATSSNNVVATIPMCDCTSSPVGVAITPDGNRAYVTDVARSAIEVIDTNPASETHNTVLTTITADVGNPVGPIAITPDGSAAFYTFGTGSVGRIDTSTNSHTSTITVGSNPTGVAVTPNGASIYVTNNGGNAVSVIPNTFPTFSPITSITVGAGPYAVAFTPNGAFAYVVNQGSNTVSVINTATQSVVATVSPSCIFTNQIAITPDGAQAYVADDECSTADVISTATNTVTKSVSVGSSPFGVAISPSGAQSETKTLGPPGTTTTFTFKTDTYKFTGVTNHGGEQVTVTAFTVAKSSFPTLTGFSSETCVPYGDYSAAMGHDTCVEFQVHCQVSPTDTTPCNFIYLVATGYDLPADLSGGIGGPDFLVAHGVDCLLTSRSMVQSIFLSYEPTVKDPTTRGTSGGPSCFVATYTPGAPPITSGTTSRFVGFQSPVSNTDLNKVKAGSTRPLPFEFFDILGHPVENLSLCNSFTLTFTATGAVNVCNDVPAVQTPWVNLASFGVPCSPGAPINQSTGGTLDFPGKSGLINHGDGNYQLNWKTMKGWAGFCANVVVTFDSGLMVVPATLGFQFN